MLSFKLSKRVPDIRILLKRDVHKSFYDSLGLTPKASNADVKKAYYKMSLRYHPDTPGGDTEKFREITTAYEVLGNNKLRKLYDQGNLPAGSATSGKYGQPVNDTTATKEQSSKENKQQSYQNFSKNAYTQADFEKTDRKKTYTGRTAHYDYDAWTKAHYAETFTRQTNDRRETQERKEMRMSQEKMRKIDTAIVGTFLVIGFLSIMFADVFIRYDNPRVITNVKEK